MSRMSGCTSAMGSAWSRGDTQVLVGKTAIIVGIALAQGREKSQGVHVQHGWLHSARASESGQGQTCWYWVRRTS